MTKFVISVLLTLCFGCLHAQPDSSVNKKSSQILSKYINSVSAKANSLEQQLDKKSLKALAQLKKQEEKIQHKLAGIDSGAAKNVFASSESKYKELEEKLKNPSIRQYIPGLDTLSTSLKFLQQNSELLGSTKEKLVGALSKVKDMQSQLQKAEDLKQFLKERKEFLKEQLDKFGFAKELKKLNKQVYYYSQQLNEYKAILNDPKKIEQKTIELLSKTKVFKEFMQKNSMLASLFHIPGNPNDPNNVASLAGLQTRASVNNLIQQQIASGGPNAMQQFQQNLQSAQTQLTQLKDKALKGGGSSSDDIMPEGFKKNDQKTKSFLKRLEYGTNFQSQKATNFFPVTSDIGLSVGYKLNDKSIIGVGASYKFGWGRNWSNLSMSSQGAGIRSFIDWKLKGSFWITGGYEQNYKSVFSSIDELRDYSSWQVSGLLGLSKTVSLKSKLFKKTKMQLLWDFLSYQQIPKTQTILFRVGYNF